MKNTTSILENTVIMIIAIIMMWQCCCCTLLFFFCIFYAFYEMEKTKQKTNRICFLNWSSDLNQFYLCVKLMQTQSFSPSSCTDESLLGNFSHDSLLLFCHFASDLCKTHLDILDRTSHDGFRQDIVFFFFPLLPHNKHRAISVHSRVWVTSQGLLNLISTDITHISASCVCHGNAFGKISLIFKIILINIMCRHSLYNAKHIHFICIFKKNL